MPDQLLHPGALPSPAHPPSRRVLHVLEATLGGTLRYLENIAEASEDLGLTLGLAYASERADHRLAPYLQRALATGWQLFPVDMGRAITPSRDTRSLLQLIAIVRRFRPEVVHCHSSKAGALGRLAARAIWPRPRIVYSPHALMVGDSRVLLGIERALARLTDGFVAITESEKGDLLQLGIGSPERIEVIPPIIDGDYFSRAGLGATSRLAEAQRGLTVAGVGRLTAQKRPLDFLRTLAKLRQLVPGSRAVWVGDGELRTQFLRERDQLGLADCVELTGWVADVRPSLDGADALLSCSAFESFGYMVAEAAAMQLPIVATRVCGTIDILGDAHPYLFASGDTAEAARLLASLREQPDRAQACARECRQHILSTFSRERMSARLAAFYSGAPVPSLHSEEVHAA